MRSALSGLRSSLLRYALPLALVALVFAIKSVIVPSLGYSTPTLLVIVPTMLAASYGGLGPGLVAAVLSAAVAEYFVPGRSLVRGFLFAAESITAAWVVASIRASRLRARASARHIQAIYDMSTALAAATTTSEVGRIILHEGVTAFEGNMAAVYLVSEPGGPLRIATHTGLEKLFSTMGRDVEEIPFDGDLPPAVVARTRRLVSSGNEEEFKTMFPSDYLARGIPPVLVCAPMLAGDRLIGVLAVGFSKPHRFSAEDRGWANALAQDCGLAIERTLLFENQRRARIETQVASRAKDDFLAAVSRALRAPLTTITMGAHVLRTRSTGRTRCTQGLDLIAKGVKVESRLVDGLIDLSRMTAHELHFERRPVDLARLVRSRTDELREVATRKGLELTRGPHPKANVLGDEPRLKQVVGELVGNAIEFTPRGGHVRVQMEADERRALVRVQDDGEGIAPDALPHVFEPFRGVEDSSDRPQLGIGLSIARYVANEHGGAVRIDSAGKGRGTTATLELPLASSK
jgi:signal transduction histidine kinase